MNFPKKKVIQKNLLKTKNNNKNKKKLFFKRMKLKEPSYY